MLNTLIQGSANGSNNPPPLSILLCADGSAITHLPNDGRSTVDQPILVGCLLILDPGVQRTRHRQSFLLVPRVCNQCDPDHLRLLAVPLWVVLVPFLPVTGSNIHCTGHRYTKDSGRSKILSIPDQSDRGDGKHRPNPLHLNPNTSTSSPSMNSQPPRQQFQWTRRRTTVPLTPHVHCSHNQRLRHPPAGPE